MPQLDPALIQLTSPPAIARSLHSEYEARLQSPNGKIHSPRHFRDRRRLSLDSTPTSSTEEGLTSPKASRSASIYSDRFIPSRVGTPIDTGYRLHHESVRARSRSLSEEFMPVERSSNNNMDMDNLKEGASTFSRLLKSELLGDDTLSPRQEQLEDTKGFTCSSPRNFLRFKAPRQTIHDDVKNVYSHSPVGKCTQRLFASPRKTKRKIPKAPYKVLDAPALEDDFYLNLVDWSSTNVLAVGLGPCVYLWSACTSQVTKLCDLGDQDSVTSVAWTQRGTHVAVGTNSGEVQIWDASQMKIVRVMEGHAARIGILAWNTNTLASGSRDRQILLRDLRSPEQYTQKLLGHKQEVCGLKWSFDNTQLASGGNDNKLMIWSARASNPVSKFSDHTAAVKAIAWSPHQNGLLASGGGTADRCIRFWNTLSDSLLNTIDTGSQVCNLMWSKNVNEIVSTHGYSLNQIIVWRYPSMTKLTTLTGHTFRVLYLAMSPDGQTIVTGAGDETLRFWNAFPGPRNKVGGRLGSALLFPVGSDIR